MNGLDGNTCIIYTGAVRFLSGLVGDNRTGTENQIIFNSSTELTEPILQIDRKWPVQLGSAVGFGPAGCLFTPIDMYCSVEVD